MNKSEWYEDRIMWRAGKFSLTDCLWKNFSMSNEMAASKILEAVEKFGPPLLIFRASEDVWTLLTNQFLVGKSERVMSAVSLDELGAISTVNDQNWPAQELKQRAQYISVGAAKTRFWTPPGEKHFSLINILKVFPLNVPS